MNEAAALAHERLNTDLEFFARHAPMLVKDKQGHLVPWVLNLAQRYAHAKVEEQRRLKGWVRALIVKGRQQGLSTYVDGRLYHKTTRRKGISSFILSHEGSSTDKLFNMVKRYHDHLNPSLQPRVGKSNTRQLVFDELGSDFAAATAGNEQAGRGGTAQIFHGSEIAYWEHAYAIQDGALQTIALLPGTEIFLESTANGPVGLFYEMCMKALRGEGDYILVFIPWFWQEEYEREPGVDFHATDEEEAFIRTYFAQPFPFSSQPIPRAKALRKLAWRRSTIVDLSTGDNLESGRAKFRTIYPSNPVEAFQASGIGLFRPDAIVAARKSNLTDDLAPRVAGVDVAGDSDNSDRTVISLRQGRHLYKRVKYSRMRPMEMAGILARLIVAENLDMVFIDRGYGEGTIDRLREMGYGGKVIGIAFNERPLNPDLYLNKRSEMICEYATWLNAGDVRIPDDDDGHAALSSIPLDDQTSNGVRFLKSKREIKKTLGGALLLDIVDADALTFAYPVRKAGMFDEQRFRKVAAPASKKGGGPLKSLARRRGR